MGVFGILKNNNFLSLAGNFFSAVFGFLSFMLLARIAPTDVFGKWILFITTSTFVEMFRFGITRIALVKFLSGSNADERKKLIGSNWVIGIVLTFIIAIVILAINFLFQKPIQNSGFSYFFEWYPLIAILNLPFNNALTVLQADMKFMKILIIRLFNVGLFVLFLVFDLFVFKQGIDSVLLAYTIITGLTSALSIALGWDNIHFVRFVNRLYVKKILNFGKYSLGTLIGSNLLKSADTFIIGLSPVLGTTAVAIYSIPLKMTEILEVPLRSFVATYFPKMSKAHRNNDQKELLNTFYVYSGMLSIIFIPLILLCVLLAPQIVIILGGSQYLSALPVYYLFCVYGLLLPIDRFTGVALDSVNKPALNFYKVMFMALVNIIGDLIAVYYFKSYFGVALVTIIMTLVGVFVGLYQLNKIVPISTTMIFKVGYFSILHQYKKIIKR